MAVLPASLAIALLVIAFASPSSALPLINGDFRHALRSESLSYMLQRRDDQGLTSGWTDLSGDAKAGVVLAPVLACVFVLFAAWFIMHTKSKRDGKKQPLLPCFRRKNRVNHKKRVSAVPQTSMYKTPGGIANAGVAAG